MSPRRKRRRNCGVNALNDAHRQKFSRVCTEKGRCRSDGGHSSTDPRIHQADMPRANMKLRITSFSQDTIGQNNKDAKNGRKRSNFYHRKTSGQNQFFSKNEHNRAMCVHFHDKADATKSLAHMLVKVQKGRQCQTSNNLVSFWNTIPTNVEIYISSGQ